MKRFFLAAIVGCCFFMIGCKSLQSAYTLTKCDYDYHKISNLSFMGISLSNGISPLALPQLATAFSGKAAAIPLGFTVYVKVQNPNAHTAAFQGLDYILSIDNVQFTQGRVNEPFSVAPGGSSDLPIAISIDLKGLLTGESKTAVTGIIKNFIGIGNEPSKVKVQLKPTLRVGNSNVTSPVFIPVTFEYGGKK